MSEQYTQPQSSIPELLESLHEPQPTVIAFEGGPCGGKTTIVNRLAEMSMPERPVVVLPEAATEHIEKLGEQGISIIDLITHDREGFLAFEADVVGTIVNNIEEAKRTLAGTDALILADRADIGAYITAEEYTVVLNAIGRTQPPHVDLVDKLVYLPSVARENAALYEDLLATNTARYETAEDAIATCTRNLGAVAMHPELSIHWGGEFEQKVSRVIDEVLNPEREVEAKYTLDPTRLPYEAAPIILEGITEMKLGALAITQSYHAWEGDEFRLRKTESEAGHITYHYTVKTGEGSVRHELQRIISQEQYAQLRQAPEHGSLVKTRQRYLINMADASGGRQRVLHADFYDDRSLCVLEVEGMTDQEAECYEIPGFIRGGTPAKELVQ